MPETKEESGAAKKSEKEFNSGSSQQSTVVPSVKESSTEELLKILQEGNLSEVSTVLRTQLKSLNLTQAGVVALRGVLDDLKKKAADVAVRINQLEVKR